MKNIVLSAVLIFCAGYGLAQDLQPGVVILSNGDTLHGNLSRRKMDNYQCVFTAAGGKELTYTPDQVTAFYVPGEIYFETLPFEKQQVFMNVLAEGKADLVEYRGHYFLRYEDKEPDELKIVTIHENVNGKEYLGTLKKYRETLAANFADCSEVQSSIKMTELGKKSLTRLFDKYNQCVGSIATHTIKQSPRALFHIGATYHLFHGKISNIGSFRDLNRPARDDSYKQTFPALYLQFSPRLFSRLSVQLSYYKVSFSSSTTTIQTALAFDKSGNGNINKYRIQYDIKYKLTVVPVMVTYSFLSKRMVQPFIGMGAGFNFSTQFSGTEQIFDPATGAQIDINPFAGPTKSASFLMTAGVNVKLGSFLVGAGVLTQNTRFVAKYLSTSSTFVINQANFAFSLSAGVRVGR